MKSSTQRVTLIFAMNQEAAPLVEKLQLQATPLPDPALPCRAFIGQYRGLEVSLVVNGIDPAHKVECIGTQAATLAAREAIRQFQPDLLINAGTCGAFKAKGSRIGDVYIGERVRYFDRRVPLSPDWQAYSDGQFTNEQAIKIANVLGMHTAVVCTGNSLEMSPTDEAILQQEPLVAKEMEAAAIAWVASLYDTPFVTVKSVTDLMDGGQATADEFQKNLALASHRLMESVIGLLNWLANH